MSQIIRRPPEIESDAIRVNKGKSARLRFTRNLYLDDVHIVYEKADSVCDSVIIATDRYAQIPFDLRKKRTIKTWNG